MSAICPCTDITSLLKLLDRFVLIHITMHFVIPTTRVLLFTTFITSLLGAPAPVAITDDDVILYGKGRFSIVKRSEIPELDAARKSGAVPPMPGSLDDTLFTFAGNETNTPITRKTKRDTTLIVPGANSRFLGWDVQISQVVKGAPTSISISSGYSISNTISVGVSSQLSLIKDFLSVSMSIDYSQSWQSTQSQQFQVTVPEGKYGAFVSNPWTNRASGNIWAGTIGGEGTLTYYQGDSFEAKKFDNLEWVDGVISLCTGNVFPLNRCLGGGTL
ncbi:hypothetical protein DE146DRAFT_646385 [Phaeosphaeria sp. MPI-PUGE-AT-0046c]|nr:hypothetical protein DE146DRAFT_646385 [Phaeosphaeria sp. MPI-PUGE-AT-0046c]